MRIAPWIVGAPVPDELPALSARRFPDAPDTIAAAARPAPAY